ncbi:MAG: HAD family hydrolase [Caldilineales bacterium]|nr:HAD family hydrolase [Caldilineales bacterium]
MTNPTSSPSAAPAFSVLLFDFEGTLVDFQWKLPEAVQEARGELRRLGFQAISEAADYAGIYNQTMQMAAQFGLDPHHLTARLGAIYDRYDRDAATRWSVRPGAAALLARWQQMHAARFGLVSNIGRRALDEALPRLGLAGLFDVIISRNEVTLLKPFGEGLRRAMRGLSAAPARTLFVGDSVTDILAAKDAGIPAAIIQGGESPSAALAAAGPAYLWKSIADLETCLDGGAAISPLTN